MLFEAAGKPLNGKEALGPQVLCGKYSNPGKSPGGAGQHLCLQSQGPGGFGDWSPNWGWEMGPQTSVGVNDPWPGSV